MHDLKTGTARHQLLCKWWMRTRKIDYSAAVMSGAMSVNEARCLPTDELYCPRWAKPLDWLHAALFGASKLRPV